MKCRVQNYPTVQKCPPLPHTIFDGQCCQCATYTHMQTHNIGHTLAREVRVQRRKARARVEGQRGEGKGSFFNRGALPISISQMSLLGVPTCGAFLLLMVQWQSRFTFHSIKQRKMWAWHAQEYHIHISIMPCVDYVYCSLVLATGLLDWTIGLTQTAKHTSFSAEQKLNILIHSVTSLTLLPTTSFLEFLEVKSHGHI